MKCSICNKSDFVVPKEINKDGLISYYCPPCLLNINNEINKIETKSLKNGLRSSIRLFLKGKPHKYQKSIGCSLDKLKKHLESQFQPGMNWENQYLWQIHHIKPLNDFKLITENKKENWTSIMKANNYKNLQPVWASEHRKIEMLTNRQRLQKSLN